MAEKSKIVQSWPSTHWSLVDQASRKSDGERGNALSALVERYLPVLRGHLVGCGRARVDQIDDLLQQFMVAKVLEREIISKADRERGRFRSFLVSALDRFVLNQLRDQKAAKRAPSRAITLDTWHSYADRKAMPDNFDVAWARQVLGQAIREMRCQCIAANRNDIWLLFRGRILSPCLRDIEPAPYSAIVRDFGFTSPAQASNLLITANRMFARVLRAVIGAYAEDESAIDQEIRELWAALAQPRAGLISLRGNKKRARQR